MRLSFSNVPAAQAAHQAADDVTAFEQNLINELSRAYQKAGFAPEEIEAYQKAATLHGFLSKLSNFSHQQRLVFLIDDWDAPLLAQLDNKPRYDAIRQSLTVFYNWLSTLNLRFLLITGIMHFQHKDVVDISMNPNFARLLGYTQSELEFNFGAHLELAAQRYEVEVYELLFMLQPFYQGFCFDEDASIKLYSPIDINSFFAQLAASDEAPPFDFFWAEAVSALKALPSLMQGGKLNRAVLDEINAEQVVLGRSELINPPLFSNDALFPLLALNGYLTIKEAVEPVPANPDERRFVYGFPNIAAESHVRP